MSSSVTRRQHQAEQTRRDIVDAGRRLFARDGYSATSVNAIAREAGVSVQTIYDRVGSKAEIVRHLSDRIDEEGDVPELASRIPAATDGRALLAIAAAISRRINERCEDIVGAVYSGASVEPELAALRDESRRRHRAGIRRLVGRIAELGDLRAGIEGDVAADVVAAMCDPQVARTFVRDYGWAWDRWERWTVDALAELVLRPGAGGATTAPSG